MSQLPDDLDLLEEHRVRWWEIPQLIGAAGWALVGFAVIGLVLLIENRLRAKRP